MSNQCLLPNFLLNPFLLKISCETTNLQTLLKEGGHFQTWICGVVKMTSRTTPTIHSSVDPCLGFRGGYIREDCTLLHLLENPLLCGRGRPRSSRGPNHLVRKTKPATVRHNRTRCLLGSVSQLVAVVLKVLSIIVYIIEYNNRCLLHWRQHGQP
jgi:hypothetical protein